MSFLSWKERGFWLIRITKSSPGAPGYGGFMKLNKWKLIFRLIFNQKNKVHGGTFNEYFADVILYALNNYQEKRGSGSCDVFLYDVRWGKDIFHT